MASKTDVTTIELLDGESMTCGSDGRSRAYACTVIKGSGKKARIFEISNIVGEEFESGLKASIQHSVDGSLTITSKDKASIRCDTGARHDPDHPGKLVHFVTCESG